MKNNIISVFLLLFVMYISIDGYKFPLFGSEFTSDINNYETQRIIQPHYRGMGDIYPLRSNVIKYKVSGNYSFYEIMAKVGSLIGITGLATINLKSMECKIYYFYHDNNIGRTAFRYDKDCTIDEKQTLIRIGGGI